MGVTNVFQTPISLPLGPILTIGVLFARERYDSSLFGIISFYIVILRLCCFYRCCCCC